MKRRSFLLTLLLFFPSSLRAGASCAPEPDPLLRFPTGNGFGYAVVRADGVVTSFLDHPYTRVRSKLHGFDHGEEEDDEDASVIHARNYLESARWPAPTLWKAGYLHQSHVVLSLGPGGQRHFAFLPFRVQRNALVLGSDRARRLELRWAHPVAKSESLRVGGVKAQLLLFEGVRKPLLVLPLGSAPTAEFAACPAGSCLNGASAWAFVSLKEKTEAAAAAAEILQWKGQTPPTKLGAREAVEFDRFRAEPKACFRSEQEKRLYRQSEAVLFIAQIREPNTLTSFGGGMINASLPPGEFAVPYVRDMAYAAYALLLGGHERLAEKALLSYFHARPIDLQPEAVRGFPYQISTTRYFGNGGEEADRSGQAEPNLEFDNWGYVLWLMGQQFERAQSQAWLDAPTYRGNVYESAKEFILKPLLGNLDDTPNGGKIVAKDTSTWEQNDEPKRHYTASTIAALGGLRSFRKIAFQRGDVSTLKLIDEAAGKLVLGIHYAFMREGKLIGAHKDEPSQVKSVPEGRAVPERNEIDGVLLDSILMESLGSEHKQAVELLERVETQLKTPNGGYRRTNGPTGYERQEFVLVGWNLARAYLRMGQTGKADAIADRYVRLAAKTHYLIPELYQAECMEHEGDFQREWNSPVGAVPMAGYGAGAYMIYMQERAATNCMR